MFILTISVICVVIFLLIIAASVRISLELVKIRRKGLSLAGFRKPANLGKQNQNYIYEKTAEPENGEI